MLRFLKASRSCVISLGFLILVACGGGGGGGGGPPAQPAPSAGAFTLGATSASFKSASFAQLVPAAIQVPMTLTGSGTATVVLGFPTTQGVPGWLNVTVTGTAPNLAIVIQPAGTNLVPLQYSATLLVNTVDANNKALQQQQIQVSYNVFLSSVSIAATPSSRSFVFGDTLTAQSMALAVTAQNTSWTISSDQPWLTVTGGAQQGNQTATLTADASTLAIGVYTANVTATNAADPTDNTFIQVSIAVVAPTLNVSPNPITIGGADGLGTSSQSVTLSLNTGANAYPWTLSVSDSGSLGIFSSSATGGSANSTMQPGTIVTLDRTAVHPGSYQGVAQFDYVVKGQTFHTTVPIAANFESQRLFPSYNGVAFSSFPSKSVLSRTLTVGHSQNIAGIAWNAASDSAWLQISKTAGVTGDSLVVTANKAGLATDHLYIGNITLSSTNPNIERTETIRAALWVGSANPANLSVPVANPYSIVANPVEPWLYVDSGGTSVSVYNVFTGALVATFSNVATAATVMAVSSDGKLLFITDMAANQTVAVDASTGAQKAVYVPSNFLPGITQVPYNFGMAYGRPNGHALLWTVFNEPILVETGAHVPPIEFIGPGTGFFKSISPDGKYLIRTNPNTSDSNSVYSQVQRYTALNGEAVLVDNASFHAAQFDFSILNLCLTNPSEHVFAATTHGFEVDTGDVTQSIFSLEDLSGGTSPYDLACGWNGKQYVIPANQTNTSVFDESGATLTSFQFGAGGTDFVGHLTALSGDNTRLISTTGTDINNVISFQVEIDSVP
jgi:BACON domain-containing protein